MLIPNLAYCFTILLTISKQFKCHSNTISLPLLLLADGAEDDDFEAAVEIVVVVVFAVVVGKKFDALVLEWLLCAKPRICRERREKVKVEVYKVDNKIHTTII